MYPRTQLSKVPGKGIDEEEFLSGRPEDRSILKETITEQAVVVSINLKEISLTSRITLTTINS